MICKRPSTSYSLGLCGLLLAVALTTTTYGAEKKHKPRWEQLAKIFDAYFAELPGHQPGGIITQSEVTPLWEMLARAKWNVPAAEREAIMALVPADKEFLVRQLHTSNGRRFMSKVAVKYPEIYDRLDMLAHTDGGGKPAVSGLIAAPDANLTVKYMFSKGGEKSWAALMPQRVKFDKPTGRIYTAESLKSRLQGLFEAAH